MSRTIDRELPWGKLVIDLGKGRVHLTQRWDWKWLQMGPSVPGGPPGPNWTRQGKVQSQTAVIYHIDRLWNHGKVRFRVRGTSEYSRKFGASPVSMVFLIIDAKAGDQHWSVSAYNDADTGDRSYVDLSTRRIVFYKTGMPLVDACQNKVNPNDAAVCSTGQAFSVAAHEFGHTLQNDDEYRADSPGRADKESIENIGAWIRARHMDAIVTELNTMILNCKFASPETPTETQRCH